MAYSPLEVKYTKDISGDEILTDQDGQHQIMMEWEKPYMEKCIELLDPSGSVLEIGFGMAYSANKICSNTMISILDFVKQILTFSQICKIFFSL